MHFPKELNLFFENRKSLVKIYKSGPGTQAFLAHQLVSRGDNVVMVVPGERELAEMRALLGAFSSGTHENPWVYFPPYHPDSTGPLEWGTRWTALHRLDQGCVGGCGMGVLLSVESLLPKWPSVDVAAMARLELTKGEEINSEIVLEQLVEWGYRRVPMVTGPGEMAMRGDILDVYSPAHDKPLRLEFFGDELEALRLFNPSSQRSVDTVETARIFPVAPALLGEPFSRPGQCKVECAQNNRADQFKYT